MCCSLWRIKDVQNLKPMDFLLQIFGTWIQMKHKSLVANAMGSTLAQAPFHL